MFSIGFNGTNPENKGLPSFVHVSIILTAPWALKRSFRGVDSLKYGMFRGSGVCTQSNVPGLAGFSK
ncbi:MAG: hypothetical protein IPJ53_08870 [Saprospiraceae bacterium]|nr:hypothetical protein [Candidatus Vicinibacter affinis]